MKSLAENATITTSTFYRPDVEGDRIRSKLAIETVRSAVDGGYSVVVVDEGSSDEVCGELKKYGAHLFRSEKKGMGNSRRQSIREAGLLGRPIIAYLDPEKQPFVEHMEKTLVPLLEGRADMVVGGRTSLASYPLEQQLAEQLGNAFWKSLTNMNFDVWCGQRTWKRELSDYFLNYQGEYGDRWDCIFIPLLRAVHANEKVIGINVNYQHPSEQTNHEEGNILFVRKRLEQLATLTKSLDAEWTRLNGLNKDKNIL